MAETQHDAAPVPSVPSKQQVVDFLPKRIKELKFGIP